MAQINHVEGEEEYVLLDLDDVCVRADIPANAPYVLSVRSYLSFMNMWLQHEIRYCFMEYFSLFTCSLAVDLVCTVFLHVIKFFHLHLYLIFAY